MDPLDRLRNEITRHETMAYHTSRYGVAPSLLYRQEEAMKWMLRFLEGDDRAIEAFYKEIEGPKY